MEETIVIEASVAPVPQHVIEQDHRLEDSASRSQEALAKHRWHWTLDESNPDRVALRVYARAVGRNQTGIRRYAHGYAAWSAQEFIHGPLGEYILRANLGVEKEAAIEAVAKEGGISFTTAKISGKHRPLVRAVKDIAREIAEDRGTSAVDEMPAVAKAVVHPSPVQSHEHDAKIQEYVDRRRAELAPERQVRRPTAEELAEVRAIKEAEATDPISSELRWDNFLGGEQWLKDWQDSFASTRRILNKVFRWEAAKARNAETAKALLAEMRALRAELDISISQGEEVIEA